MNTRIWATLCLATGMATSVAGCGPSAERADVDPATAPLDTARLLTNSIGMKLVLLPPGEFMMGSPESEEGRYSDEGPQHRVRITKPFYLGVYEVTQGQWESVMGSRPWSGRSYVKEGRDYAATYVSWKDAVEYCRKLSAKEGKEYRLPTEAEWEYACRAGTETAYQFGDDASRLSDYAWWGGVFAHGNCVDEKYAHVVGQKRPNGFGLFDMHGNVWEWCADWVDEEYYATSPVDDPQGPASGSSRVVRGGSWRSDARNCRSAPRFRDRPGYQVNDLGFRLALVPADAKATHPPDPGPDDLPEFDPDEVMGPSEPVDPLRPALAIAPFSSQQARAHQEAWAKHGGQPREITNSIGTKLVLIPPGEFMMGSPESEKDRGSYEGPQHRIRITKSLYLGVYEVTQEEYQRVMGANPSAFSRDAYRYRVSGLDTSRFPVEQVSWEDAVEFCRRLSALPAERSAGREYRLPTEAEWEYACRAGTTTRYHFGNDLSSTQARFGQSWSSSRPVPVGSYIANGFGLFDMHGNVWEWCADYYGKYYANSPVDDPQGPASGSSRVFRGGSWSYFLDGYCRSAFRSGTVLGARHDDVGFRLALVPADESSK